MSTRITGTRFLSNIDTKPSDASRMSREVKCKKRFEELRPPHRPLSAVRGSGYPPALRTLGMLKSREEPARSRYLASAIMTIRKPSGCRRLTYYLAFASTLIMR